LFILREIESETKIIITWN